MNQFKIETYEMELLDLTFLTIRWHESLD